MATRSKIGALVVLVAGALVALPLMLTGPASATTTDGPSYETCPNLSGWYVNNDESSDKPAPTADGLLFENKDLIHHATDPIDLADMDKVTGSFVATKPGKVLFKVETSAPYSSIITDADGKFWSTAMTYDQEGGQGHPVAKYSDLLGKPTKPGKPPYTSATNVVTFGIGYAVAEGDTVVKSITFHGKTYPLTCAAPTQAPTTKTPTPKATSASPVAGGIHSSSSPAPTVTLPLTSSETDPHTINWIVWVGVGMFAIGVGAVWATRARRRDEQVESE